MAMKVIHVVQTRMNVPVHLVIMGELVKIYRMDSTANVKKDGKGIRVMMMFLLLMR
jgi:hypothetical protein